MKNQLLVFSICTSLFAAGCIGDDIIFDTVEETIRIENAVDTIAIDSQYQFLFTYLNNVGIEETISNAMWSSSDPDIISITPNGLATAVETGDAVIRVEAMTSDSTFVFDEMLVSVGERTVVQELVRTGTIRTTSSYTLRGEFQMEDVDGTLVLSISEDYRASSNLPGLYIYLTNNPNTTNGATEIGKVTIFSGAHSYEIPSGVELNEFKYILYYCKPFNVKVGDGEFVN